MFEDLKWWVVDYFWGNLKRDLRIGIDEMKFYRCPVCGKRYWLGSNSVNCCRGTEGYKRMQERAERRLRELEQTKKHGGSSSFYRRVPQCSQDCTLCNGTGRKNGVICGRCDGTGKFPPRF